MNASKNGSTRRTSGRLTLGGLALIVLTTALAASACVNVERQTIVKVQPMPVSAELQIQVVDPVTGKVQWRTQQRVLYRRNLEDDK